LVKKLNARIYEFTFLIDLPDLGGSKILRDQNYSVYSLMEFSGY
jgi:adenine/guanine phosphoribosyltransferase-like PRPP-binding protein